VVGADGAARSLLDLREPGITALLETWAESGLEGGGEWPDTTSRLEAASEEAMSRIEAVPEEERTRIEIVPEGDAPPIELAPEADVPPFELVALEDVPTVLCVPGGAWAA
jgi:hypothetical protein